MIAFYLKYEPRFSEIDLGSLSIGNPGLGGTQYLFLLTVQELNKTYGKGTAVLYTDHECEYPVDHVVVGSLRDAIQRASEEDLTYLVVNARVLDRSHKEILEGADVPIVAWAHNTMTRASAELAANCPSIARVVCVSKAQYESMRDTPCFPKATFIRNGLPSGFIREVSSTDYSEPMVVFVGSLYPQKGLHNLLGIWRIVNRSMPEAVLTVIGGAQIWGSGVDLGTLGIAERHYEKVIQNKLRRLDDPSSVVFLGPRSWREINQYIAHARAGVVNPSHYLRDETFCMAAVELQSRGLPIVSRFRDDGLSETVDNGSSGFLERDDRRIARRLLELLSGSELSRSMGLNALQHSSSFLLDLELSKWKQLLNNSVEGHQSSRRVFVSRDAALLFHDRVLRYWYYLRSGRLRTRALSWMRGERKT